MPTEDFRVANAPLFEAGEIDALEWSVDFGWSAQAVPAWVEALLDRYEAQDALVAHGVELSPLSLGWSDEQDAWLRALSAETRRRRYRHFSEHYGFITAGAFVRGTPLPLPPSRALVRHAAERWKRLADATGLPVGIENLAFALSAEDAWAQAAFVRALCEEAGAFLLFDVHNLVCQAENFGLDPLALSRAYPLACAREIHVAGGSLAAPGQHLARPFRRDTHDDLMPSSVVTLLEAVLPACPALELVVLERTDRSLFGAAEQEDHRGEVRALRALVQRSAARERAPTAPEPPPSPTWIDDDDATLTQYQAALLERLSGSDDASVARDALARDADGRYAAFVRGFDLGALEVAQRMVRQWGERAPAAELGAAPMLAAVLREPGRPLELLRLPLPDPGPGQVRLAARAVGLCGTDVALWRGQLPLPLPIVLGHEIVGEIEAVGPEVALPLGALVGVPWVQRACGACAACLGDPTALHRCEAPRTWVVNGGGLSARVIVEASGCVPLPAGLAPAAAAPLLCAGFTVMSGLRKARPARGEVAAVVGVGGLGHLAIPIARALGLRVVAVTGRRDKVADALRFGADDAIVAQGDAIGEALAAAGGADIALTTGADVAGVAGALGGLRTGGRLVVAGLVPERLPLSLLELVEREQTVIGAVAGAREDLAELLALAASGRVAPAVEPFPLELCQRALERLAAGRARYRPVITFDASSG